MCRATFQTQALDLGARTEKRSLQEEARHLVGLRDALAEEEDRLAGERLAQARAHLEGQEVERVAVPVDEFRSWFQPEAGA